MSIRVRCDCGKILTVRDQSAGKRIRCPDCRGVLTVPAARSDQAKSDRPASAKPTSQRKSSLKNKATRQPPAAAQETRPPRSRPRRKKKNVRRNLIPWIATLGVCCGIGVLAWFLIPLVSSLLGGDGNPDVVRDSSDVGTTSAPEQQRVDSPSGSSGVASPLRLRSNAVTQADIANDPMLTQAQQFISLASVPNTSEAIKMIDQRTFEQRVKGPQGSAFAVDRRVKIQKLLGNFAKRSFESTTANGAVRHWQVLQKTTFDGQVAVLVRYFSEHFAPYQWIKAEETLEKFVPLMSYDEFLAVAAPLYVLPPSRSGDFGNRNPSHPETNGLFLPRAGYMYICFEDTGDAMVISDLASEPGRLRLSRACGELYGREWEVHVFGRQTKPELAAKPMTPTILGELPGDMINAANTIDGIGRFGWYVDPNAGPVVLGELMKDRKPHRAFRLSHIGAHYRHPQGRTGAELERFRADYPDDRGADTLTVCLSVIPRNREIDPQNADVIIQAAQRLFAEIGDPFLVYVQWLAAKSKSDVALTRQLRDALRQLNFETLDILKSDIEDASAANDKLAVVNGLQQLVAYWEPGDARPTTDYMSEVKRKWSVISDRQTPQTVAHANPSSRFQNRMNRDGLRNGEQSASGGNSGSSGSSDAADRPSRFRGGPRHGAGPPPMEGVITTIEIVGDVSFDVNAIAKSMMAKFQASTFRASYSNNTGRILFPYDGPLEAVTEFIDFGTVEEIDNARRTFRVRFKE